MDTSKLLSDYRAFIKQQKEQGKKVIAFIAHDNIPEEIIDAAGFIPLKMIFAGNDELMNESHEYLPPSTCSFAQTCIGLFKSKQDQYGFLHDVDYFIVSNHCVSDICTSEIITRYFNIPRLNFYLAYTHSEDAFEYFNLAIIDFKEQIEQIKGRKIKDDYILESIKKYNDFKLKLSKINDLNINGSEKLKIFQKAILFGPAILPEIEAYLEKYEDIKPTTSNKLKNIIFTGCSIFIGDYLVDLIEESGGNIRFFDTWIGNNYYSQTLTIDDETSSIEDPLNLLVSRYKNNTQGDHAVPNFVENKVPFLEKIIQDYQKNGEKIGGVINHCIKFCDHFTLFQNTIKTKLQEKGIPVLNLERDYARSNRGQLSTRIEAFMEMI